MDYALSNYDLGRKQAELMGLFYLDDYYGLGAVIRLLSDRVYEQRRYLKIIRFSYGAYSRSKAMRVTSILNRLARGKGGIHCAHDFRRIHDDIKKKYELVSHHFDYLNCMQGIPDPTPIPTHEAIKCRCCGGLFLEPIIKYNLRARFALCGSRCGYVMRLHARMTDVYRYHSAVKSKTVSTLYKLNVRSQKLPLLCFVDYLSKQQRKKRSTKNKGKFTWT